MRRQKAAAPYAERSAPLRALIGYSPSYQTFERMLYEKFYFSTNILGVYRKFCRSACGSTASPELRYTR